MEPGLVGNVTEVNPSLEGNGAQATRCPCKTQGTSAANLSLKAPASASPRTKNWPAAHSTSERSNNERSSNRRSSDPVKCNSANSTAKNERLRESMRKSFSKLELTKVEPNRWERWLAGIAVGAKINTSNSALVLSDPIVKQWFGQLQVRKNLCTYGDGYSTQIFSGRCGAEDHDRRLSSSIRRGKHLTDLDDDDVDLKGVGEFKHVAQRQRLWGLLPLEMAIRRLQSGYEVRSRQGSGLTILYEATDTDCPGNGCKYNSKNVLDYLSHIKEFEAEMWQLSDWQTKYCSLEYANARGVHNFQTISYTTPSSATRCTPPVSLLQQFYFSTQAHRDSTKQLFNNGFGSVIGQCGCQDSAAIPCPSCTTQQKSSVATCIANKLGPLSTLVNANRQCHHCLVADTRKNILQDWCQALNGISCNDVHSPSFNENTFLGNIVTLWCNSLNNTAPCQWSAPSVDSWCSSSAWSYITDNGSPLGQAEKNSLLARICDTSGSTMSYLRNSYFPSRACEDGTGAQLQSSGTPFLQSSWYSGTPLEAGGSSDGYDVDKNKIKDDYASDLYEAYLKAKDKFSDNTDGKGRVMLWSEFTADMQIYGLLYHDGGLAVGSFFLVFLYMWFTTESFFLSACGMWEVIMSIPPTMAVWAIINGDGMSTLQFLTIYMILGIGADDVFVLLDAWKQARWVMGETATTTEVFAVGYRRAFSAMLTTTFTTGAAFLFGAISPIPMVSHFCIFAAFVVVFDYIWCITFFASAVCVYERYFEKKSCCCCGKPTPAGQCCGPGCCWGGVRTLWMKLPQSSAGGSREAGGDQRFVEHMFGGVIFDNVKRFRFHLLVFWGLLVIGMIISSAVGIKTASTPPAIGKQSHDLVRFATVQLNYWTQNADQRVYVGFGLDKDDAVEKYTSENPITPEPKWGSAQALTTAAGQNAVLALCAASDNTPGVRCESTSCLVRGATNGCARDEGVWTAKKIHIPADGTCMMGRHCFMEWVRDYAKYKTGGPGVFPVPDLVDVLKSQGFRTYVQDIQSTLSSKGRHWESHYLESLTGWTISGTQLKFAWVGFNATFGEEPSNKDANDFDERWDDFVQKHVGALNGKKTSEIFNFMVTQNELVSAAVQGIATSLAVAFGVLFLVTSNIIIALIGLANIGCITVVFLGLIPILGWELGTSECIFLIAVVGLSVDYSVHLLHAYNEHHGSREEKLKTALETMGISVFSGAITTIAAAFPLFMCLMRFFSQYGAFIFFVCLFSFILAIGLLPPMLLVAGPEDDFGNLWVLFKENVIQRRDSFSNLDKE